MQVVQALAGQTAGRSSLSFRKSQELAHRQAWKIVRPVHGTGLTIVGSRSQEGPLNHNNAALGASRVGTSQASRDVIARVSAPTAPPQQPQAPSEEKVEVDREQAVPITKTVTQLRGICNKRLKFHIEYGLKRGTTENCYVIKDGKESILIDVPEQSFADIFADTLNGVVPLRDIRYIVITHLSPLRIKALRELLKRRQKGLFLSAGPLDIYLSNLALQLLRSSLGSDEEGSKLLESVTLQAARSGNSLSVGREGMLRLLPAPTPRWPDLLIAYYPQDRLLFSSKLFAAHVSPDIVGAPAGAAGDVGGFDVYGKDWKYYFDCMLAPVARQAAVTLERLDVKAGPALSGSGSLLTAVVAALRAAQDSLEGAQKAQFGAGLGLAPGDGSLLVSALCPLHGPVVQSSITELILKYRDWTSAQITASELANVAVLYASAYGNTAALAQAISRGITKAGVGVETLNLEVVTLDDVLKAVSKSSGFVIGSPTLGGHMPTQVQTALGAVLRESASKGQPCGVFGSYGWSGEAVDELETRLKDAGFQFGFDPIKVKFKPTAKDMQTAEESGTDLAQIVRKKIKKEEKAASMQQKQATLATGTEQAVGRLLGTLCVVTARDGDATSAMLASWVSQASFDPPGITIAVKQDRAVEGFLTPGSKFVLNVLAEGKEKAAMKAMLKPFKPGEDRFAGLDVKESEVSQCAILPDIASYLECQVVDRMETGDHNIVYATIADGKVVDTNVLSAVHYRKVGTSY